MKPSSIIIALAATLQLASAQEQLPREEALKYAFAAAKDLKQLQGTPIPTDVDLKYPIAVRDGEYGGMFLPEAKLTSETIAKATDKILPLGQLWLHKLTPARDGEGVAPEKLRLAKVEGEDGEVVVPQCTVGLRRTAGGSLELVVLGNSTEPLVKAPVTLVEGKSQPAIVLDAERDGSGGLVTLTLFGKYKAQLSFAVFEG